MQALEKPFTSGIVEDVGWRYRAAVPGPVLKLAE
jgi:hypothetical protein